MGLFFWAGGGLITGGSYELQKWFGLFLEVLLDPQNAVLIIGGLIFLGGGGGLLET